MRKLALFLIGATLLSALLTGCAEPTQDGATESQKKIDAERRASGDKSQY